MEEAREILRKAAKELGVPWNMLVPTVEKLLDERNMMDATLKLKE